VEKRQTNQNPDLVSPKINIGQKLTQQLECHRSAIHAIFQRKTTMSDLDRGIMKFKGADNPIVIAISAALVLGSIGALVVWALRTAYVVA
jgi:hypothetical protein